LLDLYFLYFYQLYIDNQWKHNFIFNSEVIQLQRQGLQQQ